MGAMQKAKNREFKTSLKIGLFLLVLMAVLAGIGFGVLFALTTIQGAGLFSAGMLVSMVFSVVALTGACWYYGKK
jgi:uncharacterized membrane protein YjjP (DUF1212 family)